MCSQHVTYYDSYPLDAAFGRDGRWSFAAAFLKPREFRLEREFRVAMNTGTADDNQVTLDIGDIRDIGWHTETRELVRIYPNGPDCTVRYAREQAAQQQTGTGVRIRFEVRVERRTLRGAADELRDFEKGGSMS